MMRCVRDGFAAKDCTATLRGTKGERHRRLSWLALTWAVSGAVMISLAGCSGESGPARYHLSGNVTYGGEPIPAGSITFIPDTGQGNQGPATSVDIRNGKYDTRGSGKGHVGGPHKVKITGLSGESSDEFSVGQRLFPDYELTVELPQEPSTRDFEVPGDLTMPSRPSGPVDHGP